MIYKITESEIYVFSIIMASLIIIAFFTGAIIMSKVIRKEQKEELDNKDV